MNSGLMWRVAFTLGALLVYRIGTHPPLPGMDSLGWERFFRADGGLLGALSGPSESGLGLLIYLIIGIGAVVLLCRASGFDPDEAANRWGGVLQSVASGKATSQIDYILSRITVVTCFPASLISYARIPIDRFATIK